MRFTRFTFVTFAAWVVVLLFGSREARAQSCSLSGSVGATGIVGAVQSIQDPKSPGLPAHPPGIGYNAINYTDCFYDESLQFAVGIQAASGGTLEVWAGAQDCGPLTSRTTVSAVCWPVFSGTPSTVNPTLVTVRVRDIVSQLQATSKVVTYSQASSTVCTTAQTTDAAANITLYFMVVDPSSNVCGSEVTYAVTIDMVAGDVVGVPTSSAGDGTLYINIPTTTDPDITGWNVYTDPAPGTSTASVVVEASAPLPVCDAASAATDASKVVAADDAGDDAGAVVDSGPTCTAEAQIDGGGLTSSGTSDAGGCRVSPVLVAGVPTSSTTTTDTEASTDTVDEDGGVVTTGGGIPTIIDPKYLAGFGGASSTQVTVPNGGAQALVNNVNYVVAVAATDAVGNVGPLALVTTCGVATTPDPVGDFWDTYTSEGGLAGGGFCSLDAVGVPAGSISFGLAMIGVASVLIRRRRNRS